MTHTHACLHTDTPINDTFALNYLEGGGWLVSFCFFGSICLFVFRIYFYLFGMMCNSIQTSINIVHILKWRKCQITHKSFTWANYLQFCREVFYPFSSVSVQVCCSLVFFLVRKFSSVYSPYFSPISFTHFSFFFIVIHTRTHSKLCSLIHLKTFSSNYYIAQVLLDATLYSIYAHNFESERGRERPSIDYCK